MIGFYDYTVILTYMGTFFGVFGLYSAYNGNILYAVVSILAAGLCDMFDGTVANTKKDRTIQERRFGIQIDSLNDVLCFGILPVIIGFSIGVQDTPFVIALLTFPLAAIIRLAYFNMLEEERTGIIKKGQKTFTGLPVTTSALIVPFVYFARHYITIDFEYIYGFSLLITSILFVLTFKIKKPTFKQQLLILLAGFLIFLLVMVRG